MVKELSASRQYAPMRVCADICFYFYVVSLFSFSVKYSFPDEGGVQGHVTNLIAPWALQLAILAAACFLVGLVAVRIDSAALRFFLSLLPGLSFLMSPFSALELIHVVAWAYFVIVMTIGRFDVHLDEYRRRAGVMLSAILLLTLCLIIFHFGTDDWYSKRLFGGELYGLLFFFLSVVSLRGMRSDPVVPVKIRALNAAYVILLPVLLVSAFFLLRGIVPVITFLFALLTRFLLWLYHLFFPRRDMSAPLPSPGEDDVNKVLNEEPLMQLSGKDQSPDPGLLEGTGMRIQLPSEAGFWLTLAFLAAVLVYIAVLLIRKQQKRSGKARTVRENIVRPRSEMLPRRRRRESADPAIVRQIRRIYRGYLAHLHGRGQTIAASDTSQDVLDRSRGLADRPEAVRLRELYIAARYGDPRSVTESQLEEARRCLDAILSPD